MSPRVGLQQGNKLQSGIMIKAQEVQIHENIISFG